MFRTYHRTGGAAGLSGMRDDEAGLCLQVSTAGQAAGRPEGLTRAAAPRDQSQLRRPA